MMRSLVGRYLVDQPLGEGPRGTVFAGTDTDGGPLAFKVLREDLSSTPDLVVRFLQEQAVLLSLRHPNLVSVHELVVVDNTATVVMDLVTGGDLRRMLGSNGPLLPAEVARVGAGIAAALAQSHRSGVVHGDVKPENVLMDDSVSPRLPRLTDFVIARLLGPTRAVRAAPSLADATYLAPELAHGAPATPASDLYALGVVLYELCCGVPPFVGGTPYSVVRKHVEYAAGRPDGIPDALWELIWLLIAKQPKDRPQTANEVAVVLDGMVAELRAAPCALPIETPPDGQPLTTPTQPTTPVPDDRPPTFVGDLSAGGPVSKRRRRLIPIALVAVVALSVLITWAVTRSSNTSQAASIQPVNQTSAVALPAATPNAVTPTTVPELTVAPDLVGKTLDQAQDSLPDSLTVHTVDTVDSTHTDGTVLHQDPAAGQPLTGTITLTVARAPIVTYLDSVTPADGQWEDQGSASIGGTDFTHSLQQGVSTCASAQSVEYNIAKGYRRFVATAGIDDNGQDSSLVTQLEIFGDGRELSNTKVTYGKPDPINVDVSGVLRLKVEFTPVTGTDCDGDDLLTLGTAQLLGLPGEVPTPDDSASETPTY
jgi:serine/threonine protein kinase